MEKHYPLEVCFLKSPIIACFKSYYWFKMCNLSSRAKGKFAKIFCILQYCNWINKGISSQDNCFEEYGTESEVIVVV